MKQKVLIVYSSKKGSTKRVAEAIKEGAERTGASVVFTEAAGELHAGDYGLVFIGSGIYKGRFSEDARRFVEENDWKGKRVAAFACYASSKSALAELVKDLESRGARVLNSLNIHAASLLNIIGFGRRLTEQDLIRARGFGERMTNNAFGFKIKKNSKKYGIKGYIKPASSR